jgi:hypothetical protein
VFAGDSSDITGGVKGPVGIVYVGAEFTIPNVNVAGISSAKMNTVDNAVLFIQQQITLR